MLAHESGQRHGQRVLAIIAQDDQRPHEVVPRGEKGPQRQRREYRLDRRQHDRAEDAEFARAIHTRCIEQIVGNRQRVLPHEENPENARQPRHDHAAVVVHEPQRLHQQEQWQHRHLHRNRQSSGEHAKSLVAPAEAQLGKGIPGRRIDRQRRDSRDHGDERAVERIAAERQPAEEIAIVLERRALRHQRRRKARRLARGHERRTHHPQQRDEREGTEQDERSVQGDPRHTVASRPRRAHASSLAAHTSALGERRRWMIVNATMSRNRRKAIAAATPSRHQRKPSSYI